MQVKSTVNPIPAYRQPPWIMVHLFDPLTRFLVGKLGMDDHNGTRVIEVKGRRSGLWRATLVRMLELEGQRYLVAMYGESNWVRNLRAEGSGRLVSGKQMTEFHATELTGADKLPVLHAYLKRWWSLVASMTSISSPDAPDEELAAKASLHPVFRLE
jgi:deazaflavin-dependent oxidoreductase (nitroreductase family)